MGHAIRTEFAPPERASDREVLRQSQVLAGLPFLQAAFDAVPQVLMMLNAERQVVLANQALVRALGVADAASVRGKRPGELLDCAASDEGACGCGTSRFCATCGAVKAILASQQGQTEVAECRVARRGTGEALDLRVTAVPFRVGDELFTVFSVSDISHEKRRRALERVFFHDVLNTAGNLKTLAQVLEGAGPEEVLSYRPLLERLADELLAQIREQRDLSAAESDDLEVRPAPLVAGRLVREVAEEYRRSGGAVALRVDDGPGDPELVSDPTLLRRVLGNMVKNAIEATPAGDAVTLGYEPAEDGIRFWVHNPGHMPLETQLQIFQRSFSTKGPGRGLGTYSMRLLAERYLGGSVSFRSTPAQGTVFEVRCPRALAPRA